MLFVVFFELGVMMDVLAEVATGRGVSFCEQKRMPRKETNLSTSQWPFLMLPAAGLSPCVSALDVCDTHPRPGDRLSPKKNSGVFAPTKKTVETVAWKAQIYNKQSLQILTMHKNPPFTAFTDCFLPQKPKTKPSQKANESLSHAGFVAWKTPTKTAKPKAVAVTTQAHLQWSYRRIKRKKVTKTYPLTPNEKNKSLLGLLGFMQSGVVLLNCTSCGIISKGLSSAEVSPVDQKHVFIVGCFSNTKSLKTTENPTAMKLLTRCPAPHGAHPIPWLLRLWPRKSCFGIRLDGSTKEIDPHLHLFIYSFIFLNIFILIYWFIFWFVYLLVCWLAGWFVCLTDCFSHVWISVEHTSWRVLRSVYGIRKCRLLAEQAAKMTIFLWCFLKASLTCEEKKKSPTNQPTNQSS